ncbi:transposase [Mucilaginibacter koreensis]
MPSEIEFYTATCLNWQPLLKPDEHKQIILDSLQFLVDDKRIWLYAYVIMHNHIHLLWCKQPEWRDKNIQQHFAKYTAQQLKFSLIADANSLSTYQSTQRDRAYQFWERRPHKAILHNRQVLEQKLQYIHYNPVKAGYCVQEEDYLHSSAAYYLKGATNPLITHYLEHV